MTTEPRWYCVNAIGIATLCGSESDARREATDNDIAYPRHAPHVATQLVPATPSSSVARRVSAEMQAEVERLRARLDALGHRHLDGAHLSGAVDGCLLCEFMTERDRLRARVAELEPNDRRYRWLRDSCTISAICVLCMRHEPEEWADEIDRQMAKDGA